ncbi:MAG: hypothetical protein HQL13_06885 [Candidatus Omnitrophica bacterium]|nr:hypothetical protein [Candidatus Omnitrophota bacterium]
MNQLLLSLVIAAFVLTGSCFAQAPQSAAAPSPSSAPAAAVENAKSVGKPAGHHERHPELHKALRKLKIAKQDLEKAAHDFGGHRVKARRL